MYLPETYEIAEEIAITRKEGNSANLVFEVPKEINLTHRTILFRIINRNGEVILEKSGAQWYKSDQVISTGFYPADTQGLAGKHRWVLAVSDADTFYEIGKGDFIITPSMI